MLSQKLIIELYEKQDFMSFGKTTIDSVLINPDVIYDVIYTKTKYVLDLDQKTSTFYLEDEFLSLLPIDFEKISDSVLIVTIFQEGIDLDYGLLINLDPTSESVTWWGFSQESTLVMKAYKFKIFKSL